MRYVMSQEERVAWLSDADHWFGYELTLYLVNYSSTVPECWILMTYYVQESALQGM